MHNTSESQSPAAEPRCPYFGECGGCLYQDVPYQEELRRKEEILREILQEALPAQDLSIRPVEASPREYHYRHRLDLRLLKTREQKIFVGFSPKDRFGVVDVEQCPIAMGAVSDFIPELKRQAAAVLPSEYRLANLVVRCGDEGRVHWGGIGKRSLRQQPEDYLWTEVNGLKVYYALDTFFQANLSILPRLFEVIRRMPVWSPDVTFLDLYGGVGLFCMGLSGRYGRAVLIEDSKNSIQLAHYNVLKHRLNDITVIESRVEDVLDKVLTELTGPAVAMIDPPRAGLSAEARAMLNAAGGRIGQLLYLSCQPEALGRDLRELAGTWRVREIIPFDFFPKTRHLETLVRLSPAGED
ncbi:MAG: class I SAM-dependent RNA methyltransferase [Candidatus Omnitrophica bacterium]|nr:class I SAM-dependent RNA methyltransferase [Candidatus Omnitrophota bacterium]